MIERTYRISDVVKDDFLKFPLTLLANPKYRMMSLEAKFVYALLLNRLSLSQKNGWVNQEKEVFLIYTREEVAATLNISYKKSIAAFKELIRHGLLYEQRQGRGYPNLLYVLKAELQDGEAETFTQDFHNTHEASMIPENELEPMLMPGTSRHANPVGQDIPIRQIKTCHMERSGDSLSGYQDMPKAPPKKKENKNTEFNQIEMSCLTDNRQPGEPADQEQLDRIYQKCELGIFLPNIQSMFKNAIERLYYSEQLKIGHALLPQEKVRSYLALLESDVLISALETMRQNEKRITNPTAYLMSLIFNGICEKDSALILSLPPEYQSSSDYYSPAE